MIGNGNGRPLIRECRWCRRLYVDAWYRPDGFCRGVCRQRHQQSTEQDADIDWFAVRLRQHIIRESWPPGEERQRRFAAQIRDDEAAEALAWSVPTASAPREDARRAQR